MRARGLVDVLIPRGERLILLESSRSRHVLFIDVGRRNCHVYVDRAAHLDRAIDIVLNSKTQPASVCKARRGLNQ